MPYPILDPTGTTEVAEAGGAARHPRQACADPGTPGTCT